MRLGRQSLLEPPFEQVVQNQVSGTAVPGEGKPSLQWSGPPRVSGRTSHTRDPGRRI